MDVRLSPDARLILQMEAAIARVEKARTVYGRWSMEAFAAEVQLQQLVDEASGLEMAA